MQSSSLSHLTDVPDCPIILLKTFISDYQNDSTSGNDPPDRTVLMNLATANNEFVVLNRSVILREVTDNGIIFVTEQNSIKYQDISNNPNVAVTILVPCTKNGENYSRQIRLTGTAMEVENSKLDCLWQEEALFSQIRSIICECGNPVDWNDLKVKHDAILNDYKKSGLPLNRTPTYTAFEIIPKRIDFYQTEMMSIADRIVYVSENSGEWKHFHVCA